MYTYIGYNNHPMEQFISEISKKSPKVSNRQPMPNKIYVANKKSNFNLGSKESKKSFVKLDRNLR